MQTFLPYKSFKKTAECLDYRRLGKQRVEARDILYLTYKVEGIDIKDEFKITDKGANFLFNRYRNHPAILMWINYKSNLANYGKLMCLEWIKRGYTDNLLNIFIKFDNNNLEIPWLTDEFCITHRSNLIRKNPKHYRKFWLDIKDDYKYIWPVKNLK